jgi:bloom syndrome protein
MIDVTQDCIEIAKCVRDLFNNRRFTLLHLVDILKGSEVKKIHDNGHNRTVYHGRLKSWQKADIQRLLHRLVIEAYLKEDLIFANDIPQAYLKIGPKIEALMSQKVSIKFPVHEREGRVREEVAAEPIHDSKTNKALKELRAQCYLQLLEHCRNLAAEKNVTVSSIMNNEALKAMSETFPETQAEMLKLPHVTKANYEKYGAALLEITHHFAAEKLCLFMEAQQEMENDRQAQSADGWLNAGGGDGTDWAQLGAEASTSGGSRKRRGGWSGGSKSLKKFKRTPRKKGARGGTGTRTKRGAKSPAFRAGGKRGAASKLKKNEMIERFF